MINKITLPTKTAAVAPGQGAAGTAPAPITSTPAEPAQQAMKPDKLLASLPPQVRKIMEARAAKSAEAQAGAPAAAAAPPPQAGTPAAAAEPAPAAAPAAASNPSEEANANPAPDADGVIDFAELGKGSAAPDDDDAPPANLTDAEMADPALLKKRVEDAHKDNAKLRKQRREAREELTRLQEENKTLKEAQQAQQDQPAPPSSGRYLDQFNTADEVTAAQNDAMATLRQLQENPDRETITLPGNREWKLVDGQGKSIAALAAQTAFEILEDSERRLTQINARSNSETFVSEKLPLLSKLDSSIQGHYDKALKSDWHAEAPALSLKAAIGELVTSGEYVLTRRAKAPPAKKEATPAAAAAAAAAPVNELPHSPPPAQDATGNAQVAEIRKRALKGDKQAMKEWIRLGGKKPAAAAAA